VPTHFGETRRALLAEPQRVGKQGSIQPTLLLLALRGLASRELSTVLLRKHFLQGGDDHLKSPWLKPSQGAYDSVLVYGAYLIQNDVTRLPLEPAGNPERIWISSSCHRRDNQGLKVLIELVWGYHNTWPRLLNLMPHGGVQADEKNVPPVNLVRHYHSHSVPSNCVLPGESMSESCLRSCSNFADSLHPERAFFVEVITIDPSRSWISTSSSSRASLMRGFGSRTPREFPIWMSLAFMLSL
jgi:hypothetical protein